MGNISSFTMVSVDGFFAGPNGEIDWSKPGDDEQKQFSAGHSKGAGLLAFGRTTYEMMANFWPTPEGIKSEPVTAGVMNNTPKIVFSKMMKPVKDGPVWKHIRVLPEINPDEIAKLKDRYGNITILGSGTIVQQFSNLDLIDEYQLLVHPVILRAGKYLFSNVKRMRLELVDTQRFKNGNVLLRYKPA